MSDENLHVRDGASRHHHHHHLSGQCAASKSLSIVRRSKVRRKVDIPRGRPPKKKGKKKKRGKQSSSRRHVQEHTATHFDDIWKVILDYMSLKQRQVTPQARKFSPEPKPLTIYTADIGTVTGIELLKIRHVINILAAMNVFERPSKSLGFQHTFPVIYLGLDRMKYMIQELQQLILEYPNASEDDVFQHWMDITATRVSDNRKWPSIRRLTLKMLIHIMMMQPPDKHHVVTISSLKAKCPIPCFYEVIILLVHCRVIDVMAPPSGYSYEPRAHASYANTDVIQLNPDLLLMDHRSSSSSECSYPAKADNCFRSPAPSIRSSYSYSSESTPPPPPPPPPSIERKSSTNSLCVNHHRMNLRLPAEMMANHETEPLVLESRGKVKRQVQLVAPPQIQRTPISKFSPAEFDENNHCSPGSYAEFRLPEQHDLVDCTFYDLVQEFIPRERSSSLSLAQSNPLDSPESGLMMTLGHAEDCSEKEQDQPKNLSSWPTPGWSPGNLTIHGQKEPQVGLLECRERLPDWDHVIVFTPPPPAPKLRPTPKLLFESHNRNHPRNRFNKPTRSTIRVIGGEYFGQCIKTPPKYPTGRLFWTYRKDPPLDSRMWWNDTFDALFIQAMPKDPVNGHPHEPRPLGKPHEDMDAFTSSMMLLSSSPQCRETDVYFARSPGHPL